MWRSNGEESTKLSCDPPASDLPAIAKFFERGLTHFIAGCVVGVALLLRMN